MLVTHMTAPDWVPLMRRASAIVTDSGGMTCHAAIVSRELGIPCVVGTGDATQKLRDGELVTVDATHGVVVEGAAAIARHAAGAATPAAAPVVTATKLLVNLSEPSQVERAAALPVDGVGLLRAELMVLEALDGVHPRQLIAEGRGEEVSIRMAQALEAFAAGFTPAPDHLPHDRLPHQRVPRAGRRGSVRARGGQSDDRLPRRAALHARRRGLRARARRDPPRVGRRAHEPARDAAVRAHRARAGRLPAADRRRPGCWTAPGFELWVMAEVPSVLFSLERYARLGIAGISIGSNDLTQLLLGRRPRLRAAGRDVRRARPGGRRVPAPADPQGALAGPADLDLRAGAVGAPRVRRAAGARRDRRDLRQRGRRRSHPAPGRRGRAAGAAGGGARHDRGARARAWRPGRRDHRRAAGDGRVRRRAPRPGGAELRLGAHRRARARHLPHRRPADPRPRTGRGSPTW